MTARRPRYVLVGREAKARLARRRALDNPAEYIAPVVGGIVAVGAGVGLYLYLKSTKSSSGSSGCTSDGQCGAGMICVSGQCVSSGHGGCTHDSQCGPCERCIGGTCGHQIPVQILQTSNTTGLQQGESVPTIGIFIGPALCDWSALHFGYAMSDTANVWTVTGRVMDSAGVGVPCIVPGAESTNPNIVIWNYPSSTDANGNFNFSIGLQNPDQGGAGCPQPGSTSVGTVSGNINVSIPGTTTNVPFGVLIQVNILGI